MRQRRKTEDAKPKPKTPPALDAAVKRIFAYGPSKRIPSARAGSSGRTSPTPTYARPTPNALSRVPR